MISVSFSTHPAAGAAFGRVNEGAYSHSLLSLQGQFDRIFKAGRTTRFAADDCISYTPLREMSRRIDVTLLGS